MPSHLTRQVFRRILANEPIVYRGCLRRQPYRGIAQREGAAGAAYRCRRSNGLDYSQRRTMFNLGMFRKKREPAEANMDPGMDKMMELEKMERLKARLPPPEAVANALNRFASSRGANPKVSKAPIPDNQARLFLQSLRYCLRCETERQQQGSEQYLILSKRTLRYAAWSLFPTTTAAITASHIELARVLYETSKSEGYFSARLIEDTFKTYVRNLAWGGYPQQALEITSGYDDSFVTRASPFDAPMEHNQLDDVEDNPQHEDSAVAQGDDNASRYPGNIVFGLVCALNGFVKYGSREKVFETLDMIKKRAQPGPGVAKIMIGFSLAQNDFTSARQWWQERQRLPRRSSQPATEEAWLSRQLLGWCLEHGEIEAGHEIVRELTLSNPPKLVWDEIFVWAAGTKKGVDEIDRMIGIMVQSNEIIEDRSQWRLPDVATINALVESAISRGDPYVAERFIALGRERDIEPDAKTYVLQMNYRLQVNDVDGALTAYKNLQGMDLSSNEDVSTVNRLIVALCKTNRHDFDTIMNVAADLSDRRVRFEPATVATLSLLHLSRDEKFDVIDLLNTHAYHFSTSDRETIRNDILAFAVDDKTPTALSWDAYTILREQFDEMPRTQRTDLMNSFIRRERSDMGVHVFQNMRMHSRADTMPTNDTYVAAFMSLAKMRELDSLEVVHNQLKLDYNINPSTYLLNALIIAYTACGRPRKALDFWDQIAVSREGPSYNSVHVALRACEKAPFGDLKAQEIWSILRNRGVELDQQLWASYVAALAGNGDNELALKTLEQAVEKAEVEVDEFVLGSLFSAGANKEKQDEIERWAKERYGDVWEGLVGRGVETDLAGMRAVRVDRSVAP